MPGKELVVDACVGRSAGTKTHISESRYSRDVLLAIRECREHQLVFNSSLKREWDEHASKIGSSFLVYMFQRRRVRYVSDDSFVAVMNSCAHKFTQQNERAAFEKDAHVVAAALSSDQIIISNEARLLAQLIYLGNDEIRITSIQWADPASEQEGCTRWVSEGTPFEIQRTIGAKVTPL